MSGTATGTVPVEIIQTVARKRRTSAHKLSMVEESAKPGNSVSRVARQNGISPTLLYKWRKLRLEGGTAAVETDEQVAIVSEVKALKKGAGEIAWTQDA